MPWHTVCALTLATLSRCLSQPHGGLPGWLKVPAAQTVRVWKKTGDLFQDLGLDRLSAPWLLRSQRRLLKPQSLAPSPSCDRGHEQRKRKPFKNILAVGVTPPWADKLSGKCLIFTLLACFSYPCVRGSDLPRANQHSRCPSAFIPHRYSKPRGCSPRAATPPRGWEQAVRPKTLPKKPSPPAWGRAAR